METTNRQTEFRFSELSQEAQEYAIENKRQSIWESGPAWQKENHETLKAFCDIFPVCVSEFDYGYHKYINWRYEGEGDHENMYGRRLVALLNNHYSQWLYEPKVFGRRITEKSYKVWRHPKVRVRTYEAKPFTQYECMYASLLFFTSDCVLTGYCMDYSILQPIYDFLKKPTHATFRELLGECLESWLSACEDDWDYEQSDDGIRERLVAMDSLFDERGELL